MAADSFWSMKKDLHRYVDDVVDVRRVGDESAVVTAEHSTAADLADIAASEPLPFLRHVTEVIAEYDPVEEGFDSVADRVARFLRDETDQTAVSLQTWLDGKVPYRFNRHEEWGSARDLLSDRGFDVSRVGAEWVVSICHTPDTVVVGLNRAEDSLSTWPGGQVRLARTPDQVSRAEFKLEELLQYVSLQASPGSLALDYGAAPGGWSRILAERGFEVTAVDPGDLDERVLDLPLVRHERTTAGNFLRDAKDRFDLIVNDMKMSPARSSRLMLDSRKVLKPSGRCVVTLKTGNRHVLPQLQESFGILRKGFTVEFARQLRHNRNEITVVLRNKG
ncbi:SAM-dependent methyltransferase [Salininema proteolyticum]